jgi:hypothetical protein
MFAWLGSLLGGLVSGVIQPLFTYLGNAQNISLAEYQAQTAEQQAAYLAYLNATATANALKAQQENSPFGIITFSAGFFALIYFISIVLDSMFHFHWNIAKLPAPWDQYIWVILQSFVIITPTMPLISSASAWLKAKASK